jgi:hypothetical protein
MGTVPFGSEFILYPNAIRLSSQDKIVMAESASAAVRVIDPVARTVRYVATFANSFNGDPDIRWFWLDCDRSGTVGPVDDIIFFKSDLTTAAETIDRASFDGSFHSIAFGGDHDLIGAGGLPGGGHYPWAIAVGRKRGQIISNGLADVPPFIWRIRQPTDPVVDVIAGTGISWIEYNLGRNVWKAGTTIDTNPSSSTFAQAYFPYSLRPAFSTLFGEMGASRLGFPTFDDIVAQFPTDGDVMSFHPNDGTLAGYVQSGMGSAYARPELTGRDLVYLMYFIKRSTLAGSLPTPYPFPSGELPSDVTAPVISGISATRLSPTSIKVGWVTDKPTLGLVGAGSPNSVGTAAAYSMWSNLETSYGTSHSATLTGLPTMMPTHFAVIAKDLAGNYSTGPDMVV